MIVPCLASALLAGWGLPGVIATGMCPAAPTDIPAYPCTPGEYLLRMTVGPWALPGHIIVWCGWISLTAVAWFAVRAIVGRPDKAGARSLPEEEEG